MLTPEERKERWIRQQAEREAKEAELRIGVAARLRRPREENVAEKGSREKDEKVKVREEASDEVGKEKFQIE